MGREIGGANVNGENDRLLSALREIRAIEPDERDFERRLLEVVRSVTASTSATLRRPLAGTAEIRVGREGCDGDRVRLEHSFAARSGVAVLTLERAATTPFDDGDATLLEA